MSHFINRLNAKGYFSAGAGAQFAVKKAEGAFVHCVQTHKNDGSLLPGFDLTFVDGILDISQAEQTVPASFVIPQNHPLAFIAVKAEFADLDNQQVAFCATCVAAGVTIGDPGDACAACATNIATINHLKSLV